MMYRSDYIMDNLRFNLDFVGSPMSKFNNTKGKRENANHYLTIFVSLV